MENIWSLCILGLGVKKIPNFGSFSANLSKPLSKSWDEQFDEFFWKRSFFRFLVGTSSDVRKKKHYRNVVKTNFYLFRKPVDEIYFFDFSNVFDTYSDIGRKCFWFLAKKLPVKMSKIAFYRFREYTWRKIKFIFQKQILVCLPNFKRNFFWLSAKLQQIGCQNFSLRVLETKWRNRLFTNFLVFTCIRTSSETFFDFWKFLFANLSKLLSTSSDELFDQKNFRENLLSLFCRVVIKMFSDFSQKLYIRVVKSNFYVFSKYNEETEFAEKLTSCLVHTRTLSIISSEFRGQNFPQVFKTASYTFRHFDGKQFFFFNLLNFGRNSSFWLMTIFLLQNCQNWFLRIHGNTLIKKLFEKPFVVFFPDSEQSIFWLSAKTLQRGCPNCFVRVQKTFSRCGFF